MKVKSLSCIRLFETPGSVAYQAPPSMGFPRQEYWSGVPLPSPLKGDSSVNDNKDEDWYGAEDKNCEIVVDLE